MPRDAATARHTPGPWKVRALQNIGVGEVVLTDGNLVSRDGGLDGAVYMPLADAHLIAAAPEMYEALEQIAGWLADWRAHQCPGFDCGICDDARYQELARAALAKAEGRQP